MEGIVNYKLCLCDKCKSKFIVRLDSTRKSCLKCNLTIKGVYFPLMIISGNIFRYINLFV